MTDLQYPIGKFQARESYTPEEVKANISRIESLPGRMAEAIRKLDTRALDAPYREGGWTRRQVVHHVADSHLNAYIRTKWTLTEETPLIKAYLEKEWAKTSEMSQDPALSLALLEALHKRWVILLKALTPADLQKAFIHPETKQAVSLARVIATYAWHGDHHLGHITSGL